MALDVAGLRTIALAQSRKRLGAKMPALTD
jgi:hypothetical protein